MNFHPDVLRALFLGFSLSVITGCTTTTTHREPGAANYANTDITRVQLIPWAPSRSYEKVGEIIIEPESGATWQEIDLELRHAAADLGAHAMYVVWDPQQKFSCVHVDPLASDQREYYPADGIVALAVRLK